MAWRAQLPKPIDAFHGDLADLGKFLFIIWAMARTQMQIAEAGESTQVQSRTDAPCSRSRLPASMPPTHGSVARELGRKTSLPASGSRTFG
jgi:hypothetical protein